MSDIIVAPSILSGDFANLQSDIEKLQKAGADWIHVDVMDGHFVPNITIGAPVVKALNKVSDIPLDVHLMIENPEKYLKDFIDAGSSIITVHFEATREKTKDIIREIKNSGIKVGLSIKPQTSLEEIIEYLSELDLVLIMTVEPGFGGQSFLEESAKKIKFIKDNSQKNLIIEVDGGINKETAKICKEYGANAFVAGSYIYNSSDVKKAIDSLR